MPPHQCAAATAAGHQCTHIVYAAAETLCGIHRDKVTTRLFVPQVGAIERCQLCPRAAVNGTGHCPRHEHLRPRPDLPPIQRCQHPGCMRAAMEHRRCARHVTAFVHRQRIAIWNEMYVPAVIQITERPDLWREVVAEWNAHIGEPFVNAAFVQALEVTIARELHIPELWNRHMGGHALMDPLGNIGWLERWPADAAPRPVARTELETFARDTQNIHTRVVTQQTTAALDILLNANVPSDQNTIAELTTCFRSLVIDSRVKTSIDKIIEICRDIKRWYNVGTCRMEGDFLYKRTLDGLWSKMKTSALRKELELRLWQEMEDSLGMCCDGHISRLTNVLSGFDDAFAPQLSAAEQLQNRMAVIAGMEGGIILQVAEAMAAFKELKVPQEEWEAWVDAL